MIEIKNLFLKYIREYYALYDISMHIEKNETVAILGEEHSGKTSLLRVISKLEKYNKGEIYIKNIPLKKLNLQTDVSMGYMPEKPVFLANKTVYQNYISLLSSRKIPEKEREELINNAFIEYNIEKLRDIKVEDLTLFEKYVVSLVRFALRPIEIVLIDNVFDNVSDEEKDNLISLMCKIFPNKKQTMIIATTSQEIAKKMKARIIKFENGSIIKN